MSEKLFTESVTFQMAEGKATCSPEQIVNPTGNAVEGTCQLTNQELLKLTQARKDDSKLDYGIKKLGGVDKMTVQQLQDALQKSEETSKIIIEQKQQAQETSVQKSPEGDQNMALAVIAVLGSTAVFVGAKIAISNVQKVGRAENFDKQINHEMGLIGQNHAKKISEMPIHEKDKILI